MPAILRIDCSASEPIGAREELTSYNCLNWRWGVYNLKIPSISRLSFSPGSSTLSTTTPSLEPCLTLSNTMKAFALLLALGFLGGAMAQQQCPGSWYLQPDDCICMNST